jgi:pimeloyl-ACP methyl ester carboxylesterase
VHDATTHQQPLHQHIRSNGITLHAAIQGEGPLVLLCHGFPGLWYSWRHQLPALADAGYRAVALDMRGYGRSDRPPAAAAYDSHQQIADVLGVLDHLGERSAIIVGHDFGAALACNLAVRVPDRVDGVVVMSCPYDFDIAGRGGAGSHPPEPHDRYLQVPFASPLLKPSDCFARIARQHFIHLHYFQQVGPADRELGEHTREFLHRLFWALSARGELLDWARYPAEGTGYLDVLAPAPALPWPWLSREEFDYYVAEYQRCGPDLACVGGLNNYRVADRNWALGAAYADADIERPCQFIAGELDPVLRMIDPGALAIMRERCTDLRAVDLLPDAGHFVQMEQPVRTNRALLRFIDGIHRPATPQRPQQP